MTTITDPGLELVDGAIDRFLDAHDPAVTDEEVLWGAQFDAGLAWVNFPVDRGGLDVVPSYQAHVNDRLESAGVPRSNVARNIIGYGMGAPTVLTHGTPEQQERWLRPLFTAEEVWCQLFSEPSAGSDLAGLATRAERDGDEWVVNGQKVWTTLAHTARWGMLVARTDPEQPKHRGLTYFIVDMDQPGVEVRPLRQITGEAEFNEVYFTDARIPDAYRLGEVGDGWRVSLTTLMNERVAIGAAIPGRGEGAIGMAIELWGTHGGDPVQKDRLLQLWVEAEVLRLTNIRASRARTMGTPGPEGSTAKLHWADLNKRIYAFCVDLMGPEGMLYPETYEFRVPGESAMGRRSPQMNFLRARANSIEGGTSEIMKNILGERVLGLPGEPRVDKDLPWREVPRG
ncbi:MAG: acyl-CoA dehydrogenase family protein [Acidimicrobiia bacterium]